MPISISGVQYSGIWSLAGQANAKALGTWAVPPAPKLFSWGRGGSGALGLGNTTNYSSPKQVGALNTWSKVTEGANLSLAVKTDGTLWSWGANTNGQLGLGDTANRSSPVQVGALTAWSKISAGQNFSASIKTDGTLWAWGYNTTFGSLGLGDTTNRSSPTQVGLLTSWQTVEAGSNVVLGIALA